MRFSTVNAVGLHWAEDGEPGGLPVVFGNSLGTDLRVWEPLLPHLPAGLRLIRHDARGHGLSDCPPGPWRIADLADDLAALLDASGVAAAVLCGLSVGGMVAQSLAARRPDLVRALILCDTAARIGTAELWESRIATVESDGIAALAGPILERWFSGRFRAEEPSLALWRHMLTRTPPAGYAATCAAIRDADLAEATAGLRLPALAVVGEHDGATPPDVVAATAALIPGARFHVIPGAGHLPCVETPAALAALITRFLEEIADA